VATPDQRGRRIRLTGDRFDGGRLPVDSLVELERYQELLRLVARSAWEADHPGERLPADFDDEVSLTIDRIEPGSADIFLVFEQHAAFVEYQERADDTVSEAIAAAYDARDLPDLPPTIEAEVIDRITLLGSSLEAGQSIEVYTAGPADEPTAINRETRREVIDHFALEAFVNTPLSEPAGELQSHPDTLVGRITEVDAEKATYRFESLRYGRLIGHYDRESTLLDDIRAVLNSETEAPILRVEGTLQHRRDGRAFRFTETFAVEEFAAGSEAWASRLVELAQLATGWSDGTAGSPVVVSALEGANSILSAVAQAQLPTPGIFAAEDGGVLLEWATLQAVRSVEITAESEFELFARPTGGAGTLRVTSSLQEAIEFARGGAS
jgi:hypothetical protein